MEDEGIFIQKYALSTQHTLISVWPGNGNR